MQPDAAHDTTGKDNGRHVLMITRGSSIALNRRTWQQARELVKNGYTVAVISPKSDPKSTSSETVEGVRCFRYQPPFEGQGVIGGAITALAALIWEFLLTARIFFMMGIGVIQICCPPQSISLVGAFFKIFFNKKVILDQRSVAPSLSEYERLGYWAADACIAANAEVAKSMQSRGELVAERIFIAPTGAFNADASPSSKKAGKFLIGFSGGAENDDAGKHFIAIARFIVHELKRRDVKFIICAYGTALTSLKKLAALEGVADQVSFSVVSTEEELSKTISGCDACAETSLGAGSEHSAGRIMDYMACGRPVVQFDTPGARALSAEASLYAEPGNMEDFADKLMTLLDDPAIRSRMSAEGLARAQQSLSWAHAAPQLLAAYDTVFTIVEKKSR